MDTKELSLKDIGRRVIWNRDSHWRAGVIYSFSAEAIDVVYDGQKHATRSRPIDLQWEAPLFHDGG